MKTDKPSYVYVLCDPRVPGPFVYDDLEFAYLPFYVGRGVKNRDRFHTLPSRLTEPTEKSSIIQAMIRDGYRPFSVHLAEGLSEEDGHALERAVIAKIGLEQLINQSKGGWGCEGYTHTPEAIEQIRASNRRRDQTHIRQQISAARRRLFDDPLRGPQAREKQRLAQSGKKQSSDSRYRKVRTTILRYLIKLYENDLVFSKESYDSQRTKALPVFENLTRYVSSEDVQAIFQDPSICLASICEHKRTS